MITVLELIQKLLAIAIVVVGATTIANYVRNEIYVHKSTKELEFYNEETDEWE